MAEQGVPVMERADVAGTVQAVSGQVSAAVQTAADAGGSGGKVRVVAQGVGLFRLEYSYVQGWGKAVAVAGVAWLVIATVVTQSYLGAYYGGYSRTSWDTDVMAGILSLCLFVANAVVPACIVAAGLFFGRKKELCSVTVSPVTPDRCQVSANGFTSPAAARALSALFVSLAANGSGPVSS